MTLANADDHHRDANLLDHPEVVSRILGYIDNETTFLGEKTWQEPVDHYIDPDRFASELELMRRRPTVFCPSAAVGEAGSYLARDAAGVPLLAVRGSDGRARVFRNACRHRGVHVAEGRGCKHAFVCRYHGWSYGNQGELRHVPHEYGFPGLGKDTRGLVPVNSIESGGLLFVSPEDATSSSVSPHPAALVPEDHAVLGYSETEVEANWKLFLESFLEGYHIRFTHKTTFYPVQYDNLNWIEFFGDHTRIAYPYQAIEKLRDAPLEEGAIDYYLTYVYHFFPNVIVATTPGRVNVIVLEPTSVGSTRMVSFWTGVPDSEPTRSKTGKEKGPDYRSAQEEDLAMVTSAQLGLVSGANDVLEFGLFESAIVRFYERLELALASREERAGSRALEGSGAGET
jgi:phenylpropionate dioxygenase-like ring-hydroxylating dioxygenase large terminal subunit